MSEEHIFTEKGFKELQEELQDLRDVQRPMIVEKIKEAREQGDLSENSELDAATERQGQIESRITEIEEIMKNYRIVDSESVDKSSVHFGCTVKVRHTETKQEMEFQIVGTTESDILKGKISYTSPLGNALMGAKRGQTVVVETPAGEVKYKVVSFRSDDDSDAASEKPAAKKAPKKAAKKSSK